VFGPTPNLVVSGPYTISGVVAESGRPIAGANINAFVNQGNFGYSYMYVHGALLTDSSGRFAMKSLPAGVRVWFQVYKDGYVQQCAVAPVTLQGDMAMDLALVTKANLTASTWQSAPGLRSVLGVIVEDTPTGKRPSPVRSSILSHSRTFQPPSQIATRVVGSYCAASRRATRCVSGLPQGPAEWLM